MPVNLVGIELSALMASDGVLVRFGRRCKDAPIPKMHQFGELTAPFNMSESHMCDFCDIELFLCDVFRMVCDGTRLRHHHV